MVSSVEYDGSFSNEELLALCARHDQDALRALLRRHERPVYSMLYSLLGNHEDAEEALADVFVKVWRAAGGFRGNSSFKTWLYKIAVNTARDALRARKNRPEVALEDVKVRGMELAERMESGAGDPLDHAVNADEQARLALAVSRLSDEDRLLVTLYHFRELDYAEIERITGIRANNLKVKLFRARQRLRKLLAQLEMDGDEDENELRSDTTEAAGLQPGSHEWA